MHVTLHPGHLGWTDSFNRIAFHAVPLVWWLVGALVGSALVDAGWSVAPDGDETPDDGEGRYAPSDVSVAQGDAAA